MKLLGEVYIKVRDSKNGPIVFFDRENALGLSVFRRDGKVLCPHCDKDEDITSLSTGPTSINWCPCGCVFVRDMSDLKYTEVFMFR